MRYYIILQDAEYSIFKVPDTLIQSFEEINKKDILVQGESLAEALLRFEQCDKKVHASLTMVTTKSIKNRHC